MRHSLPRVAALLLYTVLPSPAFAGGFYLQEQSPREIGRALAGATASADDASTIYYNPAGMTALDGIQISAGGSLVMAKTRQIDAGSTRTVPGQPGAIAITGTSGGNPFAPMIPIPSFYASAALSERLWLGIGVSAPFGLKLRYGPDFFGRYDSLLTDLKTYNIQPSIAWRLNDALSIGAGLNAQYAKVRLTSALPQLSPGLADGLVTVEGDDVSFGWNAGALLHTGQVQFGLAYRSAVGHRFAGSFVSSGLVGPLAAGNVDLGLTAPLNLPDILSAGAVAGVGTPTRFMANAAWYNWSRFDGITLIPANGSATVKSLDYRDSYSISVGAEHDVSPRLTLRAGAMRDKTPTNPALRTTRVPDGNRTWLSFGGSLRMSDRMSLTLSYAHNFIAGSRMDRVETFYGGTARVTARTVADTSGNVDQLATALAVRF